MLQTSGSSAAETAAEASRMTAGRSVDQGLMTNLLSPASHNFKYTLSQGEIDMLIGEVAERTGLATSAIRYYEQRGLIPRARRVAGRRQFDEKDLAPLLVVQLAIDAGFTLAETRQLVSEFGRDRWRRLAEKKRAEIRATAAPREARAGH